MSIEEDNSSKGTDLETYVFFSIIVPVYNSGKTLRYCMDSILNQSYENYEVILVDDGSNDNSWSLCEIFQAENSKVKAFHTENHGVSHARNYALNNVRGKYAVFVDSDGIKGADGDAHAAADAAIGAAFISAPAVAGHQSRLWEEQIRHVNPSFRRACWSGGGWSAAARPADNRPPQWPAPWGWR